jgi:tetratricopeptide (TPR) repeat protein
MKKVQPAKPPVPVTAPIPVAPELTAAPTRFFRGVDYGAFWTAFLVSFAVYAYTVAPTVTLEDSGELAVASAHLGVPHPPGYPLWSIITWIFTRIFAFVQFRGQPNPAWSVGLCSAFFGALASGITAILLCRSGYDLLRCIKGTTEAIGQRVENMICWAGGVVGSLLFAFSPNNWSQCTIVEVYALNAFLLVLILLLTYVWIRTWNPSGTLGRVEFAPHQLAFLAPLLLLALLIGLLRADAGFRGLLVTAATPLFLLYVGAMLAAGVYVWVRHPRYQTLYLIGFIFGLGLTNYQVLLLMLLSLVAVVLLKDRALFRDFVVVGLPYLAVLALIKYGHLPKISHPTAPETYIYLILNAAAMLAAYFYLPYGKQVAPTLLLVQLGLAVYGYMPLSSDTNPPINWGYPRTYEGFIHAISRGQYERIVPTEIFSLKFVKQVGDYLADLRAQYTLPFAILGFLPFAAWSIQLRHTRFRALYAAVAMAAAAVLLIVIEELLTVGHADLPLFSTLYRLLIMGILVLLVVGAFTLAVNELAEMVRRLVGRERVPLSERFVLAATLAGVLGAAGFYAKALLAKAADPTAVTGAADRFALLLLLLAPALLTAAVLALKYSPTKLDMDFDREGQNWFIATLCGFLVMSVFLIVLANPKGDIQDAFIQRVKFISSQALFAVWIGYGIVFGLAFVDTLFRGNKAVVWLGIGLVCLMPAVPLLMNAYDKELVRTMGGAEMNGHDFGWQFGNYQLRGAQAIMEELSPDEEPIPNPAFPEEMGPRAVFFGGTDPGRFVPTYMIFCADVRSDVYLITQNALADNTYMSVMRDLYGDEIWIPSVVDGNSAFQRYVEDVRAGRIPASADIKIENGRVSVQGVGGVMLINGILAQMIFEHNRDRHAFYVEESYVIQWMYPYLTPHGLIMKINRDTVPSLTPDNVRDDMDFWDWYTRRFLADPKFLRDVVARKSFSKLRSAIAGVYAVRGMFNEAEAAFVDALELYPLSPEANFRLADLYTRWNRYDDAIRIMEEFGRQDPNNDRAGAFVNELKGRRDLLGRRRELEAELAGGKANVGKAIELADVYRKLGMQEPFLALTRSVLENKDMPPPVYIRLAQLFAEEKKLDLLGTALELYVGKVPADVKAWLDLAAVQVVLQKPQDSLRSLQQAVRVGGDATRQTIKEDARFAPLRGAPAFRVLVGSG